MLKASGKLSNGDRSIESHFSHVLVLGQRFQIIFLLFHRTMSEDPSPNEDKALPLTSGRAKRRNLGRSARRRRKKLLEILQAERDLMSDNSTPQQHTAPSTEYLPGDRHLVWPHIVHKLRMWRNGDEHALHRQLGFVPGNALSVVARIQDLPSGLTCLLPQDTLDSPVVLRLYPLVQREAYAGGKVGGRKHKSRKRKLNSEAINAVQELDDDEPKAAPQKKHELDESNKSQSINDLQSPTTIPNSEDKEKVIEPFPTIYWLTHPLLKIWVSRLEVEGFVAKCEQRLKSDDSFIQSMRKAHESYGRERVDLLRQEYGNPNEDPPFLKALDESRGVAGMSNFAAIKCLHTHTAHYLSGCNENVVGQWVLEELVHMATRHAKEHKSSET